MKKTAIASISILLATAAVAYDIHHPNLRDAYKAADTAIAHVHEAQVMNKGIEFGGHAEKAIDLFQRAQQELIEGDKYNDMHHK
ncbi:MAG: hypothetical protein ABSH33_15345 [Steroidobacteraceae bacterium]|jgi:hypothetical protein